eukprot:1096588-Heterocapsa_arctica.AAC.1
MSSYGSQTSGAHGTPCVHDNISDGHVGGFRSGLVVSLTLECSATPRVNIARVGTARRVCVPVLYGDDARTSG